MDTQTAAVALKTAKLALANGVTVNGQISGAINLLARLGKAPQQADWVESRIAAAATSYDNLTAQSCMLELQAFRSSDDAMVYQKAVSVYQKALRYVPPLNPCAYVDYMRLLLRFSASLARFAADHPQVISTARRALCQTASVGFAMLQKHVGPDALSEAKLALPDYGADQLTFAAAFERVADAASNKAAVAASAATSASNGGVLAVGASWNATSLRYALTSLTGKALWALLSTPAGPPPAANPHGASGASCEALCDGIRAECFRILHWLAADRPETTPPILPPTTDVRSKGAAAAAASDRPASALASIGTGSGSASDGADKASMTRAGDDVDSLWRLALALLADARSHAPEAASAADAALELHDATIQYLAAHATSPRGEARAHKASAAAAMTSSPLATSLAGNLVRARRRPHANDTSRGGRNAAGVDEATRIGRSLSFSSSSSSASDGSCYSSSNAAFNEAAVASTAVVACGEPFVTPYKAATKRSAIASGGASSGLLASPEGVRSLQAPGSASSSASGGSESTAPLCDTSMTSESGEGDTSMMSAASDISCEAGTSVTAASMAAYGRSDVGGGISSGASPLSASSCLTSPVSVANASPHYPQPQQQIGASSTHAIFSLSASSLPSSSSSSFLSLSPVSTGTHQHQQQQQLITELPPAPSALQRSASKSTPRRRLMVLCSSDDDDDDNDGDDDEEEGDDDLACSQSTVVAPLEATAASTAEDVDMGRGHPDATAANAVRSGPTRRARYRHTSSSSSQNNKHGSHLHYNSDSDSVTSPQSSSPCLRSAMASLRLNPSQQQTSSASVVSAPPANTADGVRPEDSFLLEPPAVAASVPDFSWMRRRSRHHSIMVEERELQLEGEEDDDSDVDDDILFAMSLQPHHPQPPSAYAGPTSTLRRVLSLLDDDLLALEGTLRSLGVVVSADGHFLEVHHDPDVSASSSDAQPGVSGGATDGRVMQVEHSSSGRDDSINNATTAAGVHPPWVSPRPMRKRSKPYGPLLTSPTKAMAVQGSGGFDANRLPLTSGTVQAGSAPSSPDMDSEIGGRSSVADVSSGHNDDADVSSSRLVSDRRGSSGLASVLDEDDGATAAALMTTAGGGSIGSEEEASSDSGSSNDAISTGAGRSPVPLMSDRPVTPPLRGGGHASGSSLVGCDRLPEAHPISPEPIHPRPSAPVEPRSPGRSGSFSASSSSSDVGNTSVLMTSPPRPPPPPPGSPGRITAFQSPSPTKRRAMIVTPPRPTVPAAAAAEASIVSGSVTGGVQPQSTPRPSLRISTPVPAGSSASSSSSIDNDANAPSSTGTGTAVSASGGGIARAPRPRSARVTWSADVIAAEDDKRRIRLASLDGLTYAPDGSPHHHQQLAPMISPTSAAESMSGLAEPSQMSVSGDLGELDDAAHTAFNTNYPHKPKSPIPAFAPVLPAGRLSAATCCYPPDANRATRRDGLSRVPGAWPHAIPSVRCVPTTTSAGAAKAAAAAAATASSSIGAGAASANAAAAAGDSKLSALLPTYSPLHPAFCFRMAQVKRNREAAAVAAAAAASASAAGSGPASAVGVTVPRSPVIAGLVPYSPSLAASSSPCSSPSPPPPPSPAPSKQWKPQQQAPATPLLLSAPVPAASSNSFEPSRAASATPLGRCLSSSPLGSSVSGGGGRPCSPISGVMLSPGLKVTGLGAGRSGSPLSPWACSGVSGSSSGSCGNEPSRSPLGAISLGAASTVCYAGSVADGTVLGGFAPTRSTIAAAPSSSSTSSFLSSSGGGSEFTPVLGPRSLLGSLGSSGDRPRQHPQLLLSGPLRMRSLSEASSSSSYSSASASAASCACETDYDVSGVGSTSDARQSFARGRSGSVVSGGGGGGSGSECHSPYASIAATVTVEDALADYDSEELRDAQIVALKRAYTSAREERDLYFRLFPGLAQALALAGGSSTAGL